jgi:hypothetical protein
VNWWVLGLALLVLVLFGLYLSQVAGRLDRLHLRIEAARSALEVQLARRAAVVSEIAGSGAVDPATGLVLADAAAVALAAESDDSDEMPLAESDLTRVLGAAFATRDDVAALEETDAGRVASRDLETACRRVELARRFHNDAVRAAVALRRRRLVRWFRLAGHTEWPETVELDDSVPEGFGSR